MRDDNDERHEHHDHNEDRDRNDNHEHNEPKQYQAGKEQQKDRLTAPRRDALAIDSGDLASEPWMPGLVAVEFKDPARSGVLDEDLEDTSERRKPSHQWNSDLLKVLLNYQMSGWKPSFPLTYSWSKRSADDLTKARQFYRDRGRARFVTFRFAGKEKITEVAAQLRKVPEIAQAKPVARLLPTEINEPLLGSTEQVLPFASGLENQWYAFRCNLPDALEQVTGKGVVIAAIDWGFDRSHADYTAGITLRRNIYNGSQGVGSGSVIHHGTAVLGLAGARLNSLGIVGFAPESSLWAIQAGEDQVMHPEYWKEAIEFVREFVPVGFDQYRKVIILEAQTALGGNIEGELVIHQAISDAVASGIVVCVPAGNGNRDADKDDEGADIPETGSILVGATTYENAPLGNRGTRIAVYAPGDPEHDVTCTSLPERHTNYFGGTSGAVAKVAGAVALLLEADNLLTPAEVKEHLQQSKIDIVDAEGVKVGVLLDCDYAVSSCRRGTEPEAVLTKYSAML